VDIQEFPSGHPLESGHMPLAKFADRVRVTYLAGYNHSAGDLRLAPLSIFRKLGLLPQTAASHPTTHPRRERDFPQRRVPTRHPEEHSKKNSAPRSAATETAESDWMARPNTLYLAHCEQSNRRNPTAR